MADTLVIGSGIAGLTSALLLAQAGEKVTILERASRPGGLLQTYRRGSHSFASGLHYVGLTAATEFLGRLWHYLGLSADLTYIPLDEKGGEHIYFAGRELKFSNNKAELASELLALFPHDRAVIEAYFAQMAATVSRFALYHLAAPKGEEIGPAESETLASWLKRHQASPELTGALGYLSFLYGLAPEECPLYVHLIIHDSFLHGAVRLQGGGESLVKAFIKRLAAYGVTVQTGRALSKLYPQACGLKAELSDGEVLHAQRVIYSADIGALPHLLSKSADKRTQTFLKRIESLRYTAGMAGVGVALAPANTSNLATDFLRQNTYIHLPDFYPQLSPILREITAVSKTPWLFISAEEASSAQLLLPLPPEIWATWPAAASPAYKEHKAALASAIIESAAAILPLLQGSRMIDTFTPHTYERYLAIKGGAAYGPAKSADQLLSARFTAKTRIPGLYLSGQSILLPGVVGASISALAAAVEILGADCLARIKAA